MHQIACPFFAASQEQRFVPQWCAIRANFMEFCLSTSQKAALCLKRWKYWFSVPYVLLAVDTRPLPSRVMRKNNASLLGSIIRWWYGCCQHCRRKRRSGREIFIWKAVCMQPWRSSQLFSNCARAPFVFQAIHWSQYVSLHDRRASHCLWAQESGTRCEK